MLTMVILMHTLELPLSVISSGGCVAPYDHTFSEWQPKVKLWMELDGWRQSDSDTIEWIQ